MREGLNQFQCTLLFITKLILRVRFMHIVIVQRKLVNLKKNIYVEASKHTLSKIDLLVEEFKIDLLDFY